MTTQACLWQWGEGMDSKAATAGEPKGGAARLCACVGARGGGGGGGACRGAEDDVDGGGGGARVRRLRNAEQSRCLGIGSLRRKIGEELERSASCAPFL